MSGPPVRVVVVEDSPHERNYVVRTLEADGDIEVVGQAVGLADAALLISTVRPDVVTVGRHCVRVVGERQLEQIRQDLLTPILVMASPIVLTPVPAPRSQAFEVVADPSHWSAAEESTVRQRVRALHQGRPVPLPREQERGPNGVVAIAASTGGPSALAKVVSGLGEVRAPVLIVQHIHADSVHGLTSWLSRVGALPVRLAVHGERLAAGIVYVGPGNLHLKIDSGMRVVLSAEPASLHRPSADELFLSVARHVGSAGIGVVLTGMGADGVRGLTALHAAGGVTIAQDEATSAVFGMPKAALLAGAISRVLPLDGVAAAVVAASRMPRP